MGDNNNAFAAQMLHSGKLIRKLRIEKKKNVAASIGGALLYAEVQYLKTGSRPSNPTVFTLHKISVVLEVPINELF